MLGCGRVSRLLRRSFPVVHKGASKVANPNLLLNRLEMWGGSDSVPRFWHPSMTDWKKRARLAKSTRDTMSRKRQRNGFALEKSLCLPRLLPRHRNRGHQRMGDTSSASGTSFGSENSSNGSHSREVQCTLCCQLDVSTTPRRGKRQAKQRSARNQFAANQRRRQSERHKHRTSDKLSALTSP